MRGAMAAVGDASERKGGESAYDVVQVEAPTPMPKGDAMLYIRLCTVCIHVCGARAVREHEDGASCRGSDVEPVHEGDEREHYRWRGGAAHACDDDEFCRACNGAGRKW